MTYSTPLQAGSLNRVVNVQTRSLSKDAFGHQSDVWTTAFTARASIEPMSGAEIVAAGAQLGETMVQVVMRWRPGVTSSVRLTYQGNVYTVLAVLDDYARHRKLTLTCQQGLKRG